MGKRANKISAFSIYISLIIGSIVTGSLVFIAVNIAYEQAKDKSDALTVSIKDNIARKINSIDEVLYGIRTLYYASNHVGADEFRLLSTSILERHSYIKSFVYLKLTPSEKRNSFEEDMEDIGYINFSITELENKKFVPSKKRDRYFPVVFKEPFTPLSAKQLGFDYLSIDNLGESILHAIDTSDASTSSTKNSANQAQEYVTFIAIYAGKSTPDTLSERRRTVTSIVALHVDAAKLEDSHSEYEITLALKSRINSSYSTLFHYDRIITHSDSSWTTKTLKNHYEISTDNDTYTLDIETPLYWRTLNHSLVSVSAAVGLLISFLIILQIQSIVSRNNKLQKHNKKIQKLVEARTEELANEKERALTTLESITNAVITTDKHGNIDYLNPVAESITGWTREEAFGLPVHDVYIAQNETACTSFDYSLVYECIEKSSTVKICDHVTVINKNSLQETSVEISASPIIGIKNITNGAVIVSHDVSDARRLAREMTHLATHDELTKLPNRILLMDRLVQALSRGVWNNKYLAVLFLDIDRFKLVNDTHGHDVGDELLRNVADRLTSCLRDGDTVSRLGGDEFVVVLRDLANTKDIHTVAKKIIQTFNVPFFLVDEEFFSTVSVGVSIYPKDAESALDLMKKADIAMYRAKSLGKNNYVLYDDEMGKQDAKELTLETELRRAIERNEFELYYQPQVDAIKNIIVGAEALIRWNSPKHGMISPLDFIPLAEKTGLIIPISRWVLGEAAMQCKQWQTAGLPPIRMSVNISAIQFEQGNIFNDIKEVLSETKLDPKYFELELTEGALAKDPKATVNTLNKLNDIGVRLSIDDFGTGYSSLSYLKQFCVNTLKIDRCFVKDILSDPDDAAMCTAIISIAHNLKLRVIAEGVENNEQLEFLKRHDCNIIQGFFYSKPLNNEQFVNYVKDFCSHNKVIAL